MVQSLSFVQGSPYAKSKIHLTSDEKDSKPNSAVVSTRKAVDRKSWEDLVNNLSEWKDYRNDKMNKLVKEKHPDFKHKKDKRALWLDSAPSWVLEKLRGSEPQEEFEITKKSLPRREELGGSEPQEKVGMDKKPLPLREELGGPEPHEKVGMAKKPLPRRVSFAVDGEGSWKDLMENPSRWWDNRGNKPTERHPDFKNKDTGEALWLNRAPQWATEKLPLVKA